MGRRVYLSFASLQEIDLHLADLLFRVAVISRVCIVFDFGLIELLGKSQFNIDLILLQAWPR